MQLSLLPNTRPKGQILKWVGNKYKYAHIITSYFPEKYNRYIEPFLGIASVLATMAPKKAIAGDVLKPLIEFWVLLQRQPEILERYYRLIIEEYYFEPEKIYEEIKDKYNESPNPLDLMIISRTCYGGVIRFTKEGKISTPIGPHKPIAPETFSLRAKEWHNRIQNVEFINSSFMKTMELAVKNDVVYCDPPYIDSQAILYGAQDFCFRELIELIAKCKERGARVALSIDGKKKSGAKIVELNVSAGLFEREIFLDCGSSMLKRFQNNGSKMNGENVHDRLLLTW